MVGSRSRQIHSQIGVRVLREIRPILACSGAPSIRSSSSGAKKWREGLVARAWLDPSLRNSARNRDWRSDEPGMSMPHSSSRSSSLSRQLRDSGVSFCKKFDSWSISFMARNLPQRFQQAYRPHAWRHLRALNCDIEKQAAVNISVKSGAAGNRRGSALRQLRVIGPPFGQIQQPKNVEGGCHSSIKCACVEVSAQSCQIHRSLTEKKVNH